MSVATDQQYWGHLPNHEPRNQEHRNDDVGAKGSVSEGGPWDVRKQLSASREQHQASDRDQLQEQADTWLNIYSLSNGGVLKTEIMSKERSWFLV